MRVLMVAALILAGCASTSEKIDFHVREMKPTQSAFESAYPGAQHYADQRAQPVHADLVLKSDHPLTREIARIENPVHLGDEVCGVHSYYDSSLFSRQRRDDCFAVTDIHRIRMQDYKSAGDQLGDALARALAAPAVIVGATIMVGAGASQSGADQEDVDNSKD